jgi:type I restriction enzyme S subunit
MIGQIQRWKDLERWVPGGDSDWQCLHTLVPLEDTSEYPVQTPDTRQVDARYMAMLLRTPNFLRLIRTAASGTSGRKRITPENFRAIEIPLPEPEAQRRLVAAHQHAVGKAAQLDAQARQIERDAQREFEAALGLTPPPDLPKRPFQIARFRDIERWSHEGILQDAISRTVRQESTFDQPALGEAAQITHGCSHPPSTKPTGLEIWK